MDGTTSAVNYLLSPISNDYYDHHSLQPIQTLGNVSYYQSETPDCFYDHHKTDFTPSTNSYVYHHSVDSSEQNFTYGSSIYNLHSNQSYIPTESALNILQNQTRLPPVYEISSTSTTKVFKREKEEMSIPNCSNSTHEILEKNQVYDWMKGLFKRNVFFSFDRSFR